MTNESAILGLLAKQEQHIAALQAENAQLRRDIDAATATDEKGTHERDQ